MSKLKVRARVEQLIDAHKNSSSLVYANTRGIKASDIAKFEKDCVDEIMKFIPDEPKKKERECFCGNLH